MHHYAIYVQNISLKGYQWYLMRYIINNLIQYKYLGVSENVINIPKINQNYCCYVKNYQPKDFFYVKIHLFSDKPFFVASNWVIFFVGQFAIVMAWNETIRTQCCCERSIAVHCGP